MAKRKISSLESERRLIKKTATSMAKLVNDLTKLRYATEELKTKFDEPADWQTADMMYRFYDEVANLEEELDVSHYSFKQMYEELGGTDEILDPVDASQLKIV